MQRTARFLLGVVAACAVATPSTSAWGESLVVARTANATPLSISVGRFGLAAVLPQALGTNPKAPLTLTLDASNGRGKLFYLTNVGELDISKFTVVQSMTSTIGSASVQTSYCSGGSAAGGFTAIDVCAGGGTLTRAATGAQSASVTLTIPAGTSRQFQMVTQSPNSGKDNTGTLSVQVDGTGAISTAAKNS